jgi:3-dehydroquinate dehydratase II
MARSILLVQGPNLNLLGTREPALYGTTTLAQINDELRTLAAAAGATLSAVQSNHEGELVDAIQAAKAAGHDFIIINPAGFTHTAVPLRDALAAVALPFVEVHLSNIHRREAFRRLSFFSDLALGVVCGLGVEGYRAALRFALAHEG